MTVSYFNIQRFCIHDGPGIRTTVFLKGCPLDCIWCHNPESKALTPQVMFDRKKCTLCGRCLDVCSAREMNKDMCLNFNRENCILCGKCTEKCLNGANSICGKVDTPQNIIEQVKKDLSFYEASGGGMTVSGGEPAFQADAVIELIRLAKKENISCALETCGFGDSLFFKTAAENDAIFLYDIKGIDPEKHRKNVGVYPDIIHKNLDVLIEMGARIIIRLPIIPDKNDSENDLFLLCEFLSERKNSIEYAEIMPYHSLGRDKAVLIGKEPHSVISSGKPLAESWRKSLAASGVEIKISGE